MQTKFNSIYSPKFSKQNQQNLVLFSIQLYKCVLLGAYCSAPTRNIFGQEPVGVILNIAEGELGSIEALAGQILF